MKSSHITRRAVMAGLVVSTLFAFLSVYFGNMYNLFVTANQIAILPYMFLFLVVLLINPLCLVLRVYRPFSMAEIMLIFCMGSVSAGISNFGLTSQLVPIMGNLYNRHWNTEQSMWSRYVTPFMDDDFYVSEKGSQEAARHYYAALEQSRALRRQMTLAEAAVSARARVAEAEKDIETIKLDPTLSDGMRAVKQNSAMIVLRRERSHFAKTAQAWKKSSHQGFSTPEEVCRALSNRVMKAEFETADRLAELKSIMGKAEEKVEQYRKGLPDTQRAFPGLIPVASDTMVTYAGRMRRLGYGRMALTTLRRAHENLADSTRVNLARARIRTAISLLEHISKPTPWLDASKAAAEEELLANQRKQEETRSEIERLSVQGRQATPSERRSIERRMHTLNNKSASLLRELTELKDRRDAILNEMDIVKDVGGIVGDLSSLARALDQPEAIGNHIQLRNSLGVVMRHLATKDTTLRSLFVGYVPWTVWMRPLAFWGVLIGLTYLMLMTFNILIFRQWAHNEKLIYPLADLPEQLVGVHDDGRHRVPAIFRSGFFWMGAAVSAGVLGWNLLCSTHVILGLKPLLLNSSWGEYVSGTFLHGLLPNARTVIFFTMIGLSFLIPQKVSFSLWFFYVLYMVQLLTMVHLGYGVNEDSFPIEWWYTMNFATAEGGGALIVFASLVLFRCRRFILAVIMPGAVKDLAVDEQRELRLASFLFLASSAGLILMLWRGMGANLYFTIFMYAIVIILTVGLVRAVAEGGLLGFQAWCGPSHFIKTFFGMDKAWTAPSLFAPLMVYYAVLFMDIKAFIAPAMANALKIRDDMRMNRLRFHGSILGAIAIAAVTAILAEILFAYFKGGDNMNAWFHNKLPKEMFNQIAAISKAPPGASPREAGWVIFGAVAMAALLYFRQFLFWLPHPIGMIMLVNPIMHVFWVSILIGWALKSVITRYGNPDTYKLARYFFIGLIFGEMVIVILNMILSYHTGAPVVVHYNYNWK